jgi:adenylate cyclase
LVKVAQGVRSVLPGDNKYGDPLSIGGKKPAQLLGQRIANATAERPSAFREMGMGALQVWQSFAEAQGRGRGDRELAIVFTDLADFSEWTLKAGDDAALELLREVGQTLEPAFERRGGRIVKRLGDGLMATFEQVDEAVAAALEGAEAVAKLKVDGHRPRLRAGVHVGRPRKLGGDYFGADVNVAARVTAAAEPDQVLVSETVRERLESGDVALKRRWRFKEKGAPRDLKVFHARGGG